MVDEFGHDCVRQCCLGEHVVPVIAFVLAGDNGRVMLTPDEQVEYLVQRVR